MDVARYPVFSCPKIYSLKMNVDVNVIGIPTIDVLEGRQQILGSQIK